MKTIFWLFFCSVTVSESPLLLSFARQRVLVAFDNFLLNEYDDGDFLNC